VTTNTEENNTWETADPELYYGERKESSTVVMYWLYFVLKRH
jgi:hypothetical protein